LIWSRELTLEEVRGLIGGKPREKLG